MAEPGEFRFEIEGLTPDTLSLQRLQEYLPNLVEIFGYHDEVYLLRVDEGSAVPCIYARDSAVPRVQRRLLSIQSGSGSRKSYRAMERINELLVEDNTSATLRSPSFGIVIEFPGRKESKDPQVGPVSEVGELQGELIQVGGRDETISIYLRSEGEIFICTATREQGRQISAYLFNHVRVRGRGRWIRRETGKWKLVSFSLESFWPLQDTNLIRAVGALRQIGRGLEISPGLVTIDADD